MEIAHNDMQVSHNGWDFDIVGTGSKGNGFVWEDILVDWGKGLSYKKMSPRISKVRYIFITHEHGDHVSPNAIIRFLKANPFVKVYLPSSCMKKHFSDIDEKMAKKFTVIKHKDKIELDKGRVVHVIRGRHSVPTVGFVFEFVETEECVVYTTDNCNYEPFIRFFERNDYLKPMAIFAEGNYDESKLERIKSNVLDRLDDINISRKEQGYLNAKMARIDGTSVHASKQQCRKFMYKIRHSRKDTLCLVMHTSSEMY